VIGCIRANIIQDFTKMNTTPRKSNYIEECAIPIEEYEYSRI
jgi:hypothetical protein